MDKVDRRMISAVKVDKPDMLVDQKVRSKLVVDKADIVPDPEVSMDLLKDREIIGLKEFGRSKVKSEENLGEQDQKKEALLSVVKDRDMPTASSKMEGLPRSALALPTRPRTRPPTFPRTRFPKMRFPMKMVDFHWQRVLSGCLNSTWG